MRARAAARRARRRDRVLGATRTGEGVKRWTPSHLKRPRKGQRGKVLSHEIQSHEEKALANAHSGNVFCIPQPPGLSRLSSKRRCDRHFTSLAAAAGCCRVWPRRSRVRGEPGSARSASFEALTSSRARCIEPRVAACGRVAPPPAQRRAGRTAWPRPRLARTCTFGRLRAGQHPARHAPRAAAVAATRSLAANAHAPWPTRRHHGCS